MSELKIFSETNPGRPELVSTDHATIAEQLGLVGVRFERWHTDADLGAGAAQEEVIDAYREDIDRLMRKGGYQTVDVISLTADHPDKQALRKKFLSEHTHSEDEVRFFVYGEGLFSLHIKDKVYEILCQRGDLIGVPAMTTHWFDMGPNPNFTAIRLFNNPEGWVASFTGNDIAERFSRLEN